MATTKADNYVGEVFEKISNNPTAQDLDYLIEAYARIGYLCADAEGIADNAEAARKHGEATAYLNAKRTALDGSERLTERQAEAMAAVEVQPLRQAEATARTKARKLRNLLESIEQAINGVKFLNRSTRM